MQITPPPGFVLDGGAPAPRTIYGAPKAPPPQTAVDAARDGVGLQRDQIGVSRDRASLQNEQAKPIYDRAGAIGKVRDDIRADKRIINYEQSVPLWASALQSPPDTAGDEMLVNAYAKVLGPDSAVLSGESETLKQSQTSLDQIKAQMFREFGTDGYGGFTPEARAKIRAAMTARMRAVADGYRAARAEHEAYIRSLNIPDVDIEAVLGPNFGQTFREQEARYIGREPTLAKDRVQAAQPAAAGAPPIDGGGLVVDVEGGRLPASLDEASPEWLSAFAEAKRSNPGLTFQQFIAEGGKAPPPQEDYLLGRPISLGLGDIAQTAGDTLGLIGNPLNAAINGVAGTNLSTDLGKTFRDASGMPSPQGGLEQLASQMNRFGVGAGGFTGLARGGAKLATGAVRQGLSRFAQTPGRDVVGGAGAGAASEYAQQQGGGPVAQTVAGLAGGLSAYGAASRVNNLANRPASAQNALTRAGQAEGVTVNRAMADESLSHRITGTEATMAGGPRMRRGMDKVADEIQGGVRRLGKGGTALEQDVAGQAVERNARGYIERSGKKFNDEYGALEKETAKAAIPPAGSLVVIDDVLGKLKKTPELNAAEIKFLEGLRSDFSKELSVQTLRHARTKLRKQIAKGDLTFGENERTVLSIMDAASDDIARGLDDAGLDGVAARFRDVDTRYRDRMEFIKGTIQKVIGKRDSSLPPGKIFENFKAMALPKGDNAGLARMIREMDPEDQADTAATFAEALGKNAKGEFSTAWLVRQADKLPRSARENLFGKEGARSLANLVRLAKEHDRVVNQFNNSKTGIANDWRSYLGNLVFGGGAGGLASVLSGGGLTGTALAAAGTAAAGAGIKAGRDILSTRMLLNPDVGRWIANAPRGRNPAAIQSHIAKLSAIASRQPAIASEIKELAQVLTRAANDNARRTTSAAASDGSEEKNDR